jgi:hypothetical protein
MGAEVSSAAPRGAIWQARGHGHSAVVRQSYAKPEDPSLGLRIQVQVREPRALRDDVGHGKTNI